MEEINNDKDEEDDGRMAEVLLSSAINIRKVLMYSARTVLWFYFALVTLSEVVVEEEELYGWDKSSAQKITWAAQDYDGDDGDDDGNSFSYRAIIAKPTMLL